MHCLMTLIENYVEINVFVRSGKQDFPPTPFLPLLVGLWGHCIGGIRALSPHSIVQLSRACRKKNGVFPLTVKYWSANFASKQKEPERKKAFLTDFAGLENKLLLTHTWFQQCRGWWSCAIENGETFTFVPKQKLSIQKMKRQFELARRATSFYCKLIVVKKLRRYYSG